MASGLEHIPDEELGRLAAENGPDSIEANALNDLRRERTLDKQVFAYRIGEFYVVGPHPDAKTEITMTLGGFEVPPSRFSRKQGRARLVEVPWRPLSLPTVGYSITDGQLHSAR